MPQVTITHDDESTETIERTSDWSYQRELGKMWKLEIVVARPDTEGIDFVPRSDEIELDGVATGRLVEVDRSGSTWTLIAYSFEWDAKREEPTAGGDKREGTDAELVSELIESVETWELGEVQELTGPMTFIFNHAFAHEAGRRIEKNTPGEWWFRDDKSVDYLESPGPAEAEGTVTGETVDVSSRNSVTFALKGGSGGDWVDELGQVNAEGGRARSITGEIDVSGINELTLYKAERGGNPNSSASVPGGEGWADGGASGAFGGIGVGTTAGASGGAAAAIIADTEVIAVCPGGGGASNSSAAGGGGAEGGIGGAGSGDGEDGQDGEIVESLGTGGNGADAGENDGQDAGSAYVDGDVITLESSELETGEGFAQLINPVEISPESSNIDGDIVVEDRGRILDGTHFRIIGAHEGEAQISATLVPADDPATYENRVDYETDRWEPGDARSWDRWENKDVTSESTVLEEAESLAREIKDPLIEVSARIVDEEIELGEWVNVSKPSAGIDREMRVHRIETKSVEGTPAGTVDECLLSTRTIARDDEQRRLEDIQRFNVAFQGSSVSVQGGGSRQPVDDGFPAQIPFDYPDIEFENSAELQVRALPYRHYSSPNEHSHEVDIAATSSSDVAFSDNAVPFDDIEFIGSNSTYTTTFNLPGLPRDGRVAYIYVLTQYMENFDTNAPDWNSLGQIELEISDGATTIFDGGPVSLIPRTNWMVQAVHTGQSLDGNTITLEWNTTSSADAGEWRFSYGAMLLSDHQHDVEDAETTSEVAGVTPGIEETNDFPENVHVLINSEQVTERPLFATEVPLYDGGSFEDEWTFGVLEGENAVGSKEPDWLQLETTTEASDGVSEGVFWHNENIDYSNVETVVNSSEDNVLIYGGGQPSMAAITVAEEPGTPLSAFGDETDVADLLENPRVLLAEDFYPTPPEESNWLLSVSRAGDFNGEGYLQYHVRGADGENAYAQIPGVTLFLDSQNATEAEVDISGQLNVGEWNNIELTSTELGHIQAAVSVDGYKQIGSN